MEKPRSLSPGGGSRHLGYVVLLRDRLDNSFDQEACVPHPIEILMEWMMRVVHCQTSACSLQSLAIAHCLKVALAGISPGIDGMQDREAEATAWTEHAGDLANNSRQVVHVHQRQRGHGQVEVIVRKRHSRRIGDLDNEIRVSLAGGVSQRGGALDTHHSIAKPPENSCNSSLAATNVHYEPLRRWQQRQEGRKVEPPEGVVEVCRSRPPHPLVSIGVPRLSQRPLTPLHPPILPVAAAALNARKERKLLDI